MNDERPIDLTALDPDVDSGAEARFVRNVMAQVGARPPAAPLPVDPLIGIWSIIRSPALAAGIVIAVAVSALGVRMHVQSSGRPATLAQALGVPTEFLSSTLDGR